jgi:hypothetical protein
VFIRISAGAIQHPTEASDHFNTLKLRLTVAKTDVHVNIDGGLPFWYALLFHMKFEPEVEHMPLSTQFIAEQRRRLMERKQRYLELAPCERSEPHLRLKTKVALPYINAALERIAEGRYGICCDCDQPIPRERLRAVPGAIRCAGCQTDWEAKHAHP